MANTFFRTYLTAFAININAFEFVGIQEDRRTGQSFNAIGKQTPSFNADLTLFIGPENAPRDAGMQSYSFTAKPTQPTKSHSGLPVMGEVIPSNVIDAWLARLDQVIDEQLPFYSDDSPESKAAGPSGSIRVNRIEVRMPYNKPDQHCVTVFCGLYEDPDFQTQIVKSSIVLMFVTPEFAERVFKDNIQREPTAAELAEFMTANDMFDLAGFIGTPEIQVGVGSMVTQLYTTLKTRVFQYSQIDVPTIMQRFGRHLQEMYPAKAPTPKA